jgi:hypothetical protein
MLPSEYFARNCWLGAAYGPTVAELAEPLTELPARPNQALLIGAR